MQIGQKEIEQEQIPLQTQKPEESDAYSLFVYAVRSQVTRDYYLRRLKIFFNYVSLFPECPEQRCNLFATKGLKDPNWAFRSIVKFLQFQKERVEKEEITGATLRNFVKAIKLYCEMSDIPIAWKKISRGLPKTRRYANDRAPSIEEIQRICEYPDRRIKAIVCTMASCGMRLGAWDYLRWGDIEPITSECEIIAAKITIYAGDDDEYFSFITPEAYYHLEKWMEFRKECGEHVNSNSWVMRQLWNTKEGHYHHGTIKDAAKLKSSGIKRLVEDALWTQGVRKKTNRKRNRYEFQADHGFRKWFKTRCEIGGMKSMMSHSTGITDSYYRVTQSELLDDYLKAIDTLTISEEVRMRDKINDLNERVTNNESKTKFALKHKEEELQTIEQHDEMNSDAVIALSDKIAQLMEEVEFLKKRIE